MIEFGKVYKTEDNQRFLVLGKTFAGLPSSYYIFCDFCFDLEKKEFCKVILENVVLDPDQSHNLTLNIPGVCDIKPTPKNPKPGEVWKTREGGKVFIAALYEDNDLGRKQLLCFHEENRAWASYNWELNGGWKFSEDELPYDLISLHEDQTHEGIILATDKEAI